MTTNPVQPRFGCYIGNIDRSVTLEMLKQVFCQCGTIIDCSLNGREEDPYRYGFIDFATEDDRARAMKYNGYTLVGRKLKVGVSKGNVNKPEGYSNNSSGSNVNNRGGTGTSANTAAPSTIGMSTTPSVLPAAAAGGLAPTQQMEAQLLLQLIQQGSLDTASLTESQRALLLAALPSTGATITNAALNAAPAATSGNIAVPGTAMSMQSMNVLQPPFFGAPMWGPMVGMPPQGMMSMNPMMTTGRGANTAFHRGPANPPPSEETLKLREIQRKQYFKVIRDETEAYEKKLQERSAKEGRLSGGSEDGDASSASDSDTGKHSKRKKIEKSGAAISDDGAEEEVRPRGD